ncbi:MAG: phosphoribosylglycinamide formyltransferase [Phycisphaerales bacterium]|nr:phosphoribosylglycinamide formyltransferase [Phycisphaerales bacterium]
MTRGEPLRIGGLVSGGGRTILNLHECITRGELDARVAVVISSRASAGAVARCRDAGLPVEVVERSAHPGPEFHARIAELLRAARVELVCMGGFLSRWEIPSDFAGRVINIHPALLPKFGGKGYYGDHVHRAVLDAGEAESGCTVHFADDQYDHGPTILQRRVPVLPGDTVDALAHRVFEQEIVAYPEAVRMLIESRVNAPTRS